MSDEIEQGAIIPFRRGQTALEICLIQRTSGGWGIPKGRVERDETVEQTALKEAGEEAGIEGRLVGGSIGAYRYEKRGTAFRVSVFLMEVMVERDTWDEDWLRERRWVSQAEATRLLASHPAHGLLSEAFTALEKRLD